MDLRSGGARMGETAGLPDLDLEGFTRLRSDFERSTVLIGPDGKMEREWRAVKPQGHAGEVLAALRDGPDRA